MFTKEDWESRTIYIVGPSSYSSGCEGLYPLDPARDRDQVHDIYLVYGGVGQVTL